MKTAPIVLFVYNRPEHTLRTLQSLKENELADKSELFIYCDGEKENSSEDLKESIAKVREVIRLDNWCASVQIVESTANKGLAKSIVNGVTDIVKRYGSVIVLEDDMVTSKYFLRFMNEALHEYIDDNDVASVTGYLFPVKQRMPETFFLKGTYCWGWATWERAWELFNPDASFLLREIENKNLSFDFDFYGTHHYTIMLRETAEKKNNSWALPWYASAFLANKLTLLPGKSLVQNIGLDASGTHGDATNAWSVQLAEDPISIKRLPALEEIKNKKAIADFFETLIARPGRSSLQSKIKSSIKKIIGI